MPKKEYHEGCIIRDNDDPQKRGRLLVECPTIVSGETMGDWMEPCFHFVDSENSCGAFFVPSIGSMVTVEIEAEEGAEVNGLMPKWRCDIYPTDTLPDEFKENYPERRGWKTRSGHVLYFDDTDDDKVFRYTHPTGTEIVVNNDGGIELSPASGQSVFVGASADEPIVRGNKLHTYFTNLLAWLSSHTHSGVTIGLGTSGTPNTGAPPSDPSDTYSDYHKVK